MASIEEKFEECLKFLESLRPGYKYTISLGIKKGETTATVTGECYADKSLPSVFLTVRVADFSHIPEAIQIESARLIQEEVNKKSEAAAKLHKEMEELLLKMKKISDLKEKIG